jgi:transcriptional regulator with GAF, ATPase, and Fis domain
MSYSLLMLNGPSPGVTVRLDPTRPATIGRHGSRQLPLDDERASRLHARVGFTNGRWSIEDCDSRNGTRVNSQPITKTFLEPGDLIRIGQRLILFVENVGASDPVTGLPSIYKSTTLEGRREGSEQPSLERNVVRQISRVVRDSTVLCRLAGQIHKQTDTNKLLSCVIDALEDGIHANRIAIWSIGVTGQLQCIEQSGPPVDDEDQPTLVKIAVEKNRPIRFSAGDTEDVDDVMMDDTLDSVDSSDVSQTGSVVCVPIPGPGSCRGAIECQRYEIEDAFSGADTDFAVIVASQLGLAWENLEYRQQLEQANQQLRQRLASQQLLVGSSSQMQNVLDQISRVGPTNSTVLILGQSGTGKELVAQAIHRISRQEAGPYVTVNCAAFAESLLESELFGHEAGAFTGADRRRLGQFERAHQGTIFLDEVGEMSLACQAKVLRLLEGHPFQRVGGHEAIRVEVRLIAATHRDLEELVREGRFRQDLFYRLRVIDIQLPPLHKRDDDVIELASMFLEHYQREVGQGPRRLSAEAIAAIRAYTWPGNVRELKNAVERAVVLGIEEELQSADLGLPREDEVQRAPNEMASLREAEQRHIDFVMGKVNGNKTEACRILKISRGTLYTKLDADPRQN